MSIAPATPRIAHVSAKAVALGLGIIGVQFSHGAMAASPQQSCSSIDIENAPFNRAKPAFRAWQGVPDAVRIAPNFAPLSLARGGFSLFMPRHEFPAQPYLACGYLDVTAPPFSADGSGSDASADNNVAAFNAALKAGREYMLAVYVPVGTYSISDTIECVVGYNDEVEQQSDRQGACVLVGSTAAASRPLIRLATDASSFDNAGSRKSMLYFWARASDSEGGVHIARPQKLYHSGVIGIDFDTNRHAGAEAVRLPAAQGSVLEDVTITATDSFSGVLGVPAAGGSVSNVTVIGGMYGIDMVNAAAGENASQVPALVGLSLHGQTRSALRYGSLETMSLVGARITVPPEATGPAILGNSSIITNGHMIVIDSEISFDTEHPDNVAIETNSGLYLRNVYIRGAPQLVVTGDGDTLAGAASGWRHVREYSTSPPGGDRFGLLLQLPSYVEGVRRYSDYVNLGNDGAAPPSDLGENHLYDEVNFPTWETDGAINIKAPPYLARGDFETDDTSAIQRAIDDGNEVIFFPKGVYGVTETIVLRPDTKLIGPARHLVYIVAKSDLGGAFSRQHDPQPVVESSDSATGTALLARLSLFNPRDVPGSYNFHWRTGEGSMQRTINSIHENALGGPEPTSHVPMMLFSANGGGRVYGLFRFDTQERQSNDYRTVKVDGTREPLTFYQFNLEGHSGANYTLAEFNNAENVTAYSFKGEGQQRMYLVRGSSYINIYGTGGFSTCKSGDACIEIFNSSPIRIAGALKRGGPNDNPPIRPMIKEVQGGGTTITTTRIYPIERPILYSRGELW